MSDNSKMSDIQKCVTWCDQLTWVSSRDATASKKYMSPVYCLQFRTWVCTFWNRVTFYLKPGVDSFSPTHSLLEFSCSLLYHFHATTNIKEWMIAMKDVFQIFHFFQQNIKNIVWFTSCVMVYYNHKLEATGSKYQQVQQLVIDALSISHYKFYHKFLLIITAHENFFEIGFFNCESEVKISVS